MTRVAYDLRFAFRSLAKRPFFSLLVVFILGLGLGAATAVVDLANMLAWRPIQVPDPGGVVKVYTAAHQGFVTRYRGTSFPDFEDYRDGVRSLSGLTAANLWRLRVDAGQGTELLWTAGVTGEYFEVLGLRAAAGRLLVPEDDHAGAENVAVLSHHLWRALGAEPDAMGRTLRIEGEAFTVVGVAPRGFRSTVAANAQDVYIPLSTAAARLPVGEGLLTTRDRGSFDVLGRLAEGATREQVQAELDVLARRLDQDHPSSDERARVVTVTEADLGHPIDLERLGSTFQLLGVAVTLLLLITCANVAHLLLARAAGRRREMAVRLSIGAGRRALLRQLLTESFLLALAGGVVGVGVAWGARTALATIAGPEFTADMRFDVRVLGLSFLACLAATVVFGLAPALAAARVALTRALKDGTPGGGRRRFLAGRLLGAGQVALSVVLLSAGALLLLSLQNRFDADLGIDDEHLAISWLSLPETDYAPDEGTEFFARLVREVRSLPGIESAGQALIVPPILFDVQVPVRRPGEDRDAAAPRINFADAGYFETLGIPLRRGRLFDARDARDGVPVMLVNELLAEQLFPGEDPLGRTVEVQGRPGDPGPEHVIVGVVGNVTQRRATPGGEPTMYFSWSQRQRSSRQIVLRSSLPPDAVFTALRERLRDLDPELAWEESRTGAANRQRAFVVERMQAQAVAAFAIFGFLLAVVGIFGVLSYSVSQRVREIGIRTAVGARSGQVLRLFVGEGLVLAAAGALVGLLVTLAATFLAARPLDELLYGVAPRDAGLLAAVLLVVLASSAVAAYVPARRAARLDPLEALRDE